jgi:lysozyme family protein
MALFEPAYALIKKHEGGYANDPADAGGETYAGISRVAHPSWSGWPIIDNAKPLRNNAKVPLATKPVEEWYEANIWDRHSLGALPDQQTANLLLDTLTLHGKGGRLIQQVCVEMGKAVKVDGSVGPNTIGAIRLLSQPDFRSRLISKRLAYVKALALEKPSNIKFLPGWTSRILSFGKAYAPIGALTFAIVGAVGYFLVKKATNA